MTFTILTLSRRLSVLCLAGLLAAHAFAAGEPTAADAPLMPEFATPDLHPLPDYFGLAVSRTSAHALATWQRAHPRPGLHPALVVAPVQSQALGVSASFRAMVGALLDRQLAERAAGANRQSDLFDVNGPFGRSMPPSALDALAADFPSAPMLVAYVGVDAQARMDVTLTWRPAAGGAATHPATHTATRVFTLQPDGLAVLAAIDQALPKMLDELGVTGPAAHRPMGAGCIAADWNLQDLSPGADPVRRTCHALLMGLLLPDVGAVVDNRLPQTPDALAWLAESWATAADSPDAAWRDAVRQIVTTALAAGPGPWSTQPLVHSPDPVLGVLARMLSRDDRSQRSPIASSRAATMTEAARDAHELPPFAAALVRAQEALLAHFGDVDLCGIEAGLGAKDASRHCADHAQPVRAFGQGRDALALGESWRFAAAYQAIAVEGLRRGDREALARAWADVPSRFAGHPLLALLGAATHQPARTGSQDDWVASWRRALQAGLDGLATFQYAGALEDQHDLSRQFLEDPILRSDPTMQALADDFARLRMFALPAYDRAPAFQPTPLPDHHALFLAPAGTFRQVSRSAVGWHPMTGGNQPVAGPPASGGIMIGAHSRPAPTTTTMTFGGTWGQPLGPPVALQRQVAQSPDDLDLRVKLAIALAKRGAPLSEARRVVDERQASRRREDAIDETFAWSSAASAFFNAGELPLAREYYQRSVAFHTGSAADMRAQMRLALLDGDARLAYTRAMATLERYDDAYSARDAAGLAFRLGDAAAGWHVLMPRLALGDALVWRAAMAGLRHDGLDLKGVQAWVLANRLDGARTDKGDLASRLLVAYATIDRQPGDEEIALLSASPTVPADAGGQVRLARLAMVPPATITAEEVRTACTRSRGNGMDTETLSPLCALALWRATRGHAPDLDALRRAPLDGTMQELLSKAIVLALDGDTAASLACLRAARLDLSRVASDALPTPLGQAQWNLFLPVLLTARETGHADWRQAALDLARVDTAIVPYEAWPFAGVAALSTDAAERARAACVAARMDPQSWLLKGTGVRVDPGAAACAKSW